MLSSGPQRWIGCGVGEVREPRTAVKSPGLRGWAHLSVMGWVWECDGTSRDPHGSNGNTTGLWKRSRGNDGNANGFGVTVKHNIRRRRGTAIKSFYSPWIMDMQKKCLC